MLESSKRRELVNASPVFRNSICKPLLNFVRAREALRQCIPNEIWKEAQALLQEDAAVKEWAGALAKNLERHAGAS